MSGCDLHAANINILQPGEMATVVSPISKTQPMCWVPSRFSALRIWSTSHRQLNIFLKGIKTAHGISLGL